MATRMTNKQAHPAAILRSWSEDKWEKETGDGRGRLGMQSLPRQHLTPGGLELGGSVGRMVHQPCSADRLQCVLSQGNQENGRKQPQAC
eukprot:212735-Hanusia_phi.AAC.1